LRDQLLVLHQGGAGCLVADFLGRTAHVDVDDLRAQFDVANGRFGQHLGVAAGDLYRAGLGLAVMLQAQA